jgi:hypothetical protein
LSCSAGGLVGIELVRELRRSGKGLVIADLDFSLIEKRK